MIIYTPMTKKAMQICYEAHSGQKDKSGVPYVFHPVHLAEQMETEDEICTALLHDVIEDSAFTLSDIRDMGFSEAVLEALQLLTRSEDMPYMDYVERLKSHALARRIKLADLRHNSDAGRLVNTSEKDMKRIEKYKKAMQLLTEYDE